MKLVQHFPQKLWDTELVNLYLCVIKLHSSQEIVLSLVITKYKKHFIHVLRISKSCVCLVIFSDMLIPVWLIGPTILYIHKKWFCSKIIRLLTLLKSDYTNSFGLAISEASCPCLTSKQPIDQHLELDYLICS